MFDATKRESRSASFLTGIRRILPFGRDVAAGAEPEPEDKPAEKPADKPAGKTAREPAAKPALSEAELGKARALGFFCGALTRGDDLYADAGAGAAVFARCVHPGRADVRADLRETFAQACIDGGHVKHVRELDAFINHSPLADRELALELTHALRVVLAREKRGSGFVYENGTDRSIAIFKHLLSLVRRAPDVFATLAAPEGGPLDVRSIEHRLLDERLDHADQVRAAPLAPMTVSEMTAEIARRIGLDQPYTAESVHAARRAFAARWHPDRAPAHKREQATQALAAVNAALDEIAQKLAG
ncbi:hypothetical protein [Rhodoblastus acidophilus]|uniref:hypothetical protein n=1 Tax=Rhodoblastus acidophilus TaxID=1074 RepID=UPI000B5104C6|nr:hypothetical protein [Rhodoblastus acidophilus]PPQ40075.1 hypothetical protein CKO16_04585 [Rhodoblastus acidophilus]RAI21122.1 hypothetical protein CH337_08360 [Rhodoblastus acidophilus]